MISKPTNSRLTPRPTSRLSNRSLARQLMRIVPLVPLLLAVLLIGVTGCDKPKQSGSQKSSSSLSAQRRASKTNSLFRSIVAQLNRLPESNQLVLTPPSIVLDARSSSNGQDVLATLTRPPGVLEGPYNVMQIPGGNAGFKSLEIAPGDTIKYFIVYDRETRERIQESGEADIVTMDSIDLMVAQVLDNNTLIIAGGLPAEISVPSRIEIWRNLDDVMKEISSRLGRYTARRDPPLTWQPTPDSSEIKQLTERLNQWLRQSRAGSSLSNVVDYSALITTLPEALRTDENLAPLLESKELLEGKYALYETRLVQEATWLEGVSNWARGDASNAFAEARSLFDWTIRNVQLIETAEASPHFVWESLLYGRGTAEQRAWIFASLCQQQNLPAVVLEVPLADSEKPYPLVGVSIKQNEKRDLVLFDPTLGLPLPIKNLDAEINSAITLTSLLEDDNVLRSLDLPNDAYPITSENLAKAEYRVVATPFSLTERAKRLDQQLTGVNRLALAFDLEAIGMSFSVNASAEGKPPTLWSFPFQTIVDKFEVDRSQRNQEVKAFLPFAWRPRLWKARTLHFRGNVEEEGNVKNDDGQTINDFREAQKLYMSRRVRPANGRLTLEKLGTEIKQEIYFTAKTHGTYWLSQIAYDQQKHRNALQWIDNKTLASQWSELFADGIRYQRSRIYEATGEIEKAVELLEADDSPQKQGNQLRAKWLNEASQASVDDEKQATE